MNSNYYSINISEGHCHKCGAFTKIVTRLNKIKDVVSRKTDLCKPCAIKIFEEKE